MMEMESTGMNDAESGNVESTMAENSYAELHCLSNFSFLRGASHAEELVLQAETLGYQALAMTDECSVAGIVRAWQAIRQHQLRLKLIVGSEFMLAEGDFCVLLCPDRTAYAELCRLITLARRRSAKGEYCLFRDDLREAGHCFLLWRPRGATPQDAAMQHWLAQQRPQGTWLLYERLLSPQESCQHDYRQRIQQLSAQTGWPIVCAGNVHMHCPERQALQDTLEAIRQNTTVEALGNQLFANAERCLRPLDKLHKLYPERWRQETLNIARRCTFQLESLRYEYPSELVPEGMSAGDHLRRLVRQGMLLRFPEGCAWSTRRIIVKELKLIREQGYEYFFLTVHDIVQFAKQREILYQGRGSAANSVVCYCLEITAVDPRQINVLFERFISKERDEPPDIDVDFEHQRREEVIQYIYQKYSRERAALAATVIRFRFKSALRSVGKALGLQESQLDDYIRHVNRRDEDEPWSDQLKALGLNTGALTSQHLIRLTQELLGFPRHLSQHVGGFVISAGPLHELVPVENASMAERTVIQWDKDDLESLGLLKVDILALGMLSAIRKTFGLLEQHYRTSVTMADISRRGDDPAVYKMLQKADSIGVFQVESRAQMSMLPRMKPATYYDLVIQIAIIRPGPIQGGMVHPYLRRRAGEEVVDYPSKAVEGVLKRTLGVPIFQEQVIKLAMVAAGFSGGEADKLRRAMASWRKSGEVQKFHQKLIVGMTERGYSHEYAERIYQQICGFGEYGFPESHSASFALLAYVSAWLKYYYPAAFYCALLNSLPMGFYSPSQLVQDAARHQIDVRAIDINVSAYDHMLEPEGNEHALRLGLRLVKGLSEQGARHLVSVRPAQGFRSMAEIQACGLNKKDLGALASADAFFSLSTHRYQARWELTVDRTGQDARMPSLFQVQDFAPASIIHGPDERDNLLEDYGSHGLSLRDHPIALLRRHGLLTRSIRACELNRIEHRSLVTVTGVVTGRQSPGTASGVTFITLEDETGNINVVVWRNTARAQRLPFLTATIMEVKGFLEREGEVIHVIAGKLTDMTHLLKQFDARSRDFH